MFKRLLLWLAAPLMAMSMASAAHAQPFTPEQENQIRAVLRDYLIKHPDVLEEAQAALEAKRAAERRVKIENDPRRFVTGPANAPITIVEFFDYRCPYCHAAAQWVEAKMRARKDIRWVFVEFPILGPNSLEASKAAIATMKQGKYFAFHRALYQSQTELTTADIDSIAKSAGVDVPRMRRDMDDPAIMGLLQDDHDIAAAEKINGTPAFMINGVWFTGFQPDEMDKHLRTLPTKTAAK